MITKPAVSALGQNLRCRLTSAPPFCSCKRLSVGCIESCDVGGTATVVKFKRGSVQLAPISSEEFSTLVTDEIGTMGEFLRKTGLNVN